MISNTSVGVNRKSRFFCVGGFPTESASQPFCWSRLDDLVGEITSLCKDQHDCFTPSASLQNPGLLTHWKRTLSSILSRPDARAAFVKVHDRHGVPFHLFARHIFDRLYPLHHSGEGGASEDVLFVLYSSLLLSWDFIVGWFFCISSLCTVLYVVA
ncbi:hypothetical protein BDM02DRAFT_2509074 [Thelephora ganbajun]|uniref:Uncharacterized protein n=1 Tax=Thelephora ganbajun TaxID=370292 RepID=A0ACB6ZE04_THEGA|nr:hypothetical protein BDM02DRAFT_2509074 [Thelephora ganbajun]